MNLMVLLFSVASCAFLQGLLPAWEFLGGAKPPFLLGGVLYYSLSRTRLLAVIAAVLAGLLQDALDLVPLGFSVWAFLVVCSLVTHYQKKIFGNHWFAHMTIGAFASTGMVLCLYILLLAGGSSPAPSDLRSPWPWV